MKDTVKPVLTATSEQRPPVNNGQSEAIAASLSLTYQWSFSDNPLHNDHIFQVPRVAVVHRFDCILKIHFMLLFKLNKGIFLWSISNPKKGSLEKI